MLTVNQEYWVYRNVINNCRLLERLQKTENGIQHQWYVPCMEHLAFYKSMKAEA